MNKKDLMLRRTSNWHKYHVPGKAKYTTRGKNAIHISPANSKDNYAHEHEKLDICLKLRKIKHQFITEAVCNRTGLKHDVVDLDTGDIYEIETNKNRAKRFIEVQKNYDVNIIVVKLWEKAHQESASKTA